MNIGKRLQDLRAAKEFSQGDIEKRTGLLRCYISRVENGHTVPSLETLERLAKALGIEIYQVFFEGKGAPVPISVANTEGSNRKERELLKYFRGIKESDKSLVIHVARDLSRRASK